MLQVKNRQIDMEKDGKAIPCPGISFLKTSSGRAKWLLKCCKSHGPIDL